MEISNTWDRFKNHLEEIKGNLAGFRGYNIVRDIPLYEVHHHPFYIDYAYKIYNSHTRIDIKNWKLSMTHSPHGYYLMEKSYHFDSFKLNDILTSASMMKCNHHYFKYQSLAKQEFKNFDHIVELGGGCGDMAKFIRNMGYKQKYTIIDLPEVLPILEFNLYGYNIDLTTKPVASNDKSILFISTWGISECPIKWRDEVLNTLNPTNWLIAYQREFENIDNAKYFQQLEGIREDFPVLNWDGGSEYILK